MLWKTGLVNGVNSYARAAAFDQVEVLCPFKYTATVMHAPHEQNQIFFSPNHFDLSLLCIFIQTNNEFAFLYELTGPHNRFSVNDSKLNSVVCKVNEVYEA